MRIKNIKDILALNPAEMSFVDLKRLDRFRQRQEYPNVQILPYPDSSTVIKLTANVFQQVAVPDRASFVRICASTLAGVPLVAFASFSENVVITAAVGDRPEGVFMVTGSHMMSLNSKNQIFVGSPSTGYVSLDFYIDR